MSGGVGEGGGARKLMSREAERRRGDERARGREKGGERESRREAQSLSR